ncbi:MAG: beta-lactamase family protein [Gammaproteobacteria bacterium]|nr:beta-lactamase family protein [Gammaproteobacteria bacterium]
MNIQIEEITDRLVQKQTDKPAFPGIALSIYRTSDQLLINSSAGNLANNHPFFIASATKLYITAIILQLARAGRLQLDDPLTCHLPETELHGVHNFKSRDYSASLTIRHLMAHTSGLPDYFQQEVGGQSLLGRLQEGKDSTWSYEDALRWTKEMPAIFPPGTGRKAYYSDSNYQILGRVIEQLEEADIGTVLKRRVFEPLGLTQTYLYTDASDLTPRILNYKNAPLEIRQAMTSFGADGGIVSTAPEMLVFLRAFFEGDLFDSSVLVGLYDWRKVMFPLQYGNGVMLFATPWFFSPFKKQPDLIGHSGLSGAFAFYAPQTGTYLTGTVNQVANPAALFQLMRKAMDLL